MGGWRRRRCTQTRHGGRWGLSRTHSFIHSLVHTLFYQYSPLFIFSFVYILSLIHTLICSYTHLFILLCTHSFISTLSSRSSSFTFIHLPIHLTVHHPPVSLWCGQPLLRHAGVCVCVCGALAATRARDALAALGGGWADPAHTHTDGCRRRAQAALVCTRGTGNGTENSGGVCTEFMTFFKEGKGKERKRRGNW